MLSVASRSSVSSGLVEALEASDPRFDARSGGERRVRLSYKRDSVQPCTSTLAGGLHRHVSGPIGAPTRGRWARFDRPSRRASSGRASPRRAADSPARGGRISPRYALGPADPGSDRPLSTDMLAAAPDVMSRPRRRTMGRAAPEDRFRDQAVCGTRAMLSR